MCSDEDEKKSLSLKVFCRLPSLIAMIFLVLLGVLHVVVGLEPFPPHLLTKLPPHLKLASGCSFELGKEFPANSPLLFNVDDNNNYSLVKPKLSTGKKVVEVAGGKSVVIACPGDGNGFSDSSFSTSTAAVAVCIGDNNLQNSGKRFKLKDLGCKKKTKANIKITGSCASGKGNALIIAFDMFIDTKAFSYPVIDLCFNIAKSVTYYSTHIVDGMGLLASEDEQARPSFVEGLPELYPDLNPSDLYTQASQHLILEQILGSKGLAEDIMNMSFLAKGHLSPDADFIFSGTQYATYFYSNVAPEWQSVNGGLWLALENAVRTLARSTSLDYTVHTGTHGVLTLEDVNGNKKEIYLHEGKALPVPKFYWKVMVEPKSKQGMAFVALNSPLPMDGEWPCTDICEQHAWGTPTWRNKLICCEVDEFMKSVVDVPKVSVNGLLPGPRLLELSALTAKRRPKPRKPQPKITLKPIKEESEED